MATTTISPPAPAQSGDPFLAVQAALDALPEKSAPGATFITAMKGALAKTRATCAEVNRAKGGRAAGEMLAGATDRLLGILLAFAARRAGFPATTPGVSLLAMGSYGRRELAPFSDIDLMLLHDPSVPEDRLESLVGNLLRPLWDGGLQVGHSVRNPQDCLNAMEEAGDNALETATSVLEARVVAGDAVFGGAFLKEDLPEYFRRRGRTFVDAKFKETLRRWQGRTVRRTQPNVKESPGALRDFQLAEWIDRASVLSGHLPRLESRPLVSSAAIDEARLGYEKLLTFRVSLHALCGRKQDVLDFQMQQAVAADLNYEPAEDLKAAELLLRDYFRSATAVHRLANTVTRRYLEEAAVASRDIERLRRRRIDDDFTRVGDYLYASHDNLFAGAEWVEPAFRAFIHCARCGISVSQDVAEAIRARLPQMNDALRRDPAAAAHFQNLMTFREGVGRTLRMMRDVGLLGAFLPEFGEIEGMVISDVFHDFTVDEHTLLVVEAVDRLYRSVEESDQFRRQLLEALPRPQLLRMACLFHDLGKSRGAAGHSERGALMMPTVGERMAMPDADVRTLIFLVQEHLTLSKVSQRRDLGEGELLKNLAQKIGSKERLDLLFLLTYCDSISVGHGSYPLWKDALLTELHQGIQQHMKLKPDTRIIEKDAEGKPTGALEDTGALEKRLAAWAKTPEEREIALEHCHRVPRRYLVEVSVDEAISHLETLKRMRANGKDSFADVRGSGDLVDIWVVSTDRPKRFSQICGAFLGAGVSVVSAIAYTRDDGLILDHFRVTSGLDNPNVEPEFWQRVSREVEGAMSGGSANFLAKIDSARRRIPRTPRISRVVEPEVRVDNRLSDRFTVVDVKCGDRIGLLYSLSRALADLSCDIHFAKIATNQGSVTDVFYISDSGGGQVTDPEKMLNIRRLLKAVAADFQEASR